MLNPLKVRKILKKGIPGTARVHAMTTPARGAAKYNLGMTLQVFVEGRTPYEVQDQWIVSAKTPVGFGMMLPVRVDPKDPTEVAIDWDAHLAAQAAADEERRAGLAAMGPVGAVAEPGGAPAGGGTPNLVAGLERLAEMHRDGLLTDEQFEAAKRRLLDG